MQPLPATWNRYGGVEIALDELTREVSGFSRRLAHSLEQWQAQGATMAWLDLPRERSHWIEPALELGFEFHDCSADYLRLVCRLMPAASIPPCATHTIGVGGVVLSPEHELLAVLESYELERRPQYWKLPGGMLEPGEDIASGVVREVREETGVETRFEGIVSIRHHHRGQFATSNLYVVCRLTPLTHQARPDGVELARATWMPVAEYLGNEHIGLLNKHAVELALAPSPLRSVKLEGYMDGPESYELFASGSAPAGVSPVRES